MIIRSLDDIESNLIGTIVDLIDRSIERKLNHKICPQIFDDDFFDLTKDLIYDEVQKDQIKVEKRK